MQNGIGYDFVPHPLGSLLMPTICKLESLRPKLSYRALEVGAVFLLLCTVPTYSHGQTAAEAATVASSSAGMTTAVTKALGPAVAPVGEANSPFPSGPDRPPLDETNRKSLEQRAGKDAAKLLLQSVPDEALIYIDGMLVGRTPLLLILPPGKRRIEMRGQRQEFGEGLIDLAPNETRQFALTLTSRYFASVTAHTAAPLVATGVTGISGGAPVSVPPSATDTGPSFEEVNRKALEQRAGRDAAKLSLQSVPDGAMIYIDKILVGHAPLQLMVAPGEYKVEMRGPHGELSERLVGVLAQRYAKSPTNAATIKRTTANTTLTGSMLFSDIVGSLSIRSQDHVNNHRSVMLAG